MTETAPTPLLDSTPPGPYSIGTDHWSGIAKVAEECGELTAVLGKLISTNGSAEHWDGAGNLVTRIEDESADVLAAVRFLIESNGLDAERIAERAEMKLDRFRGWQVSQAALGTE